MDCPNEMQLVVESDPYSTFETFVKPYKEWIENGRNQLLETTNIDILKLHEKFIIWKYYEYFEKTNTGNKLRQRQEKFVIDKYCQELAISQILKFEMNEEFEVFETNALSLGIVQSYGGGMEFISKTFTDFFAAKNLIELIKRNWYEYSDSFNKKYILMKILKKPKFQLVRTFINLLLKNVVEASPLEKKEFDKSLKKYGLVMEEILTKNENLLIDEKGTILHIAVLEGNKNIVCFLLDCLKGHSVSLKKFLFAIDKEERSVLDLAREKRNDEIIQLLLDTATG